MANMGYCRFRNTLNDLRDCEPHMDDAGKLSEEEKEARLKLIELCEAIAGNYGRFDMVDIKDGWADYDE